MAKEQARLNGQTDGNKPVKVQTFRRKIILIKGKARKMKHRKKVYPQGKKL